MGVLTTSSLPATDWQKLTFSDAPFDIDKHVTEKIAFFLINYYLGTWCWQIVDFTSETVLDSNVYRSENTCIHMRTQPAECKRCGGIAHLRVHVEREIGCVC